jgi:hypothetical protein
MFPGPGHYHTIQTDIVSTGKYILSTYKYINFNTLEILFLHHIELGLKTVLNINISIKI